MRGMSKMEDKVMNIYQAMAKILKDVDAVGKDRSSQGQYSFKYRGIDDVMNALHTAFGEYGVFMTQEVLEHNHVQVLKKDGSPGGLHHIAKIMFHFNASDGSRITSICYGECIENGDKGIGKCMSYALKTCLLQTFLIPTEDDSKDPDNSNSPTYSEGGVTAPVKTGFSGKPSGGFRGPRL
jgi:hypothetical protein